jgi:hypothetical protein
MTVVIPLEIPSGYREALTDRRGGRGCYEDSRGGTMATIDRLKRPRAELAGNHQRITAAQHMLADLGDTTVIARGRLRRGPGKLKIKKKAG